jgi:hypothetical protein
MAGRVFHSPHGGIRVGYDYVVSEFCVSGSGHRPSIPSESGHEIMVKTRNVMTGETQSAMDEPELLSQIVAAKIKPIFPHYFDRNEEVPDELIGATIIAIGMADVADSNKLREELMIDYRPSGSTQTIRLMLSYDDTGMWVSANVDLETAAGSPSIEAHPPK